MTIEDATTTAANPGAASTPTDHPEFFPGGRSAPPVAATIAPAFIDAPTRFRVLTCPTCAAAFAVPMDVYLMRLDGRDRATRTVHCFDGHPIDLQNDWRAKVDGLAAVVSMAAELRQARYDLDRLRAIGAAIAAANGRHEPAEPVTGDELDRRYRHVFNRAKRADGGKVVCRFCEELFCHERSLRSHLMRKHQDAIATAAPEDFAP